MKKIRQAWWLVLAVTLLSPTLLLQAQMKAKMTAKDGVKASISGVPPVVYKETKLKNGLRVLLVEDHDAPVISFALIYDVGSRNEKAGRTGFAHLFEHMMFQGSENIGKSEHFILIDNNGGQMNGTTNEERTLYFETLPSNQLDLGLYMEADRMRGLDITKENLDNQRNAVQEERRLGLDNQAYGVFFEKFGEMQWDNPNYKHSVIGSMADLNAASVADVSDFFRTYYAPNNAVLTVVGDFDPKIALAKIKQYFENIPKQSAPPPVDAAEPAQTAERRFAVEDGLAQLPLMLISYKTTAGNQPDIYALQLLGNILGSGQSSRLYQKLVKDKQLVLNVGSNGDNRRGPNAFGFNAIIAPGQKAEDAEAAIYAEVERIQTEGVTDAELDKAKAGRRRAAIQSRQSSLGRAIALTEAAVAWKDPNFVNTSIDKYLAVSKADIQRVAQQYLKAANRTVGIATPKPKAAKSGE